MDLEVRVPSLKSVKITSPKITTQKNIPLFIEFKNEIMIIGIFILILLTIYHMYWSTKHISDTLARRQARVEKTFQNSH